MMTLLQTCLLKIIIQIVIMNCDRNSKETTGHPKINVLLASWGVAAINNS